MYKKGPHAQYSAKILFSFPNFSTLLQTLMIIHVLINDVRTLIPIHVIIGCYLRQLHNKHVAAKKATLNELVCMGKRTP
jgi:hypothetical protein